MDNIINNLPTLVIVIVGFFLIKKVTSLIFKILTIVAIIGLGYYVYQGGDMTVFTNIIDKVVGG